MLSLQLFNAENLIQVMKNAFSIKFDYVQVEVFFVIKMCSFVGHSYVLCVFIHLFRLAIQS